MDEKQLLKLSTLISVVGVIIIYAISMEIEVPTTKISEISKDRNGEILRTCGAVSSTAQSQKGTLFIKLTDEKTIDIVFFPDVAEGLGAYILRKGDSVCVTGEVGIYKQKVEIIGNKYEKVI